MNSKPLNKQDLTNEIKAEALRLGFFACGIARAEHVDKRQQTISTAGSKKANMPTWSIWRTTQINDLTPDY